MKKIIVSIFVMAAIFAMLYAFLCYAWIGAEYRLEGDVHFGKVDQTAACFICCVIIDYLFGSAKRKKKDTSDGKYVHM